MCECDIVCISLCETEFVDDVQGLIESLNEILV